MQSYPKETEVCSDEDGRSERHLPSYCIEVVIMMNEDRTGLSHPSQPRTEHVHITSSERPSASLRGTLRIEERSSWILDSLSFVKRLCTSSQLPGPTIPILTVELGANCSRIVFCVSLGNSDEQLSTR